MKFSTPYFTTLKRISVQLGLVAWALVYVDAVAADEQPLNTNAPLVYVNKHIGFNVKGFKYTQKEYPCHIDEALVGDLIEQARVKGIRLESVGTIDKIRNGVVPVLAIDIEKLVLGERKFGVRDNSNLPMVEVTAALVKGKNNLSYSI